MPMPVVRIDILFSGIKHVTMFYFIYKLLWLAKPGRGSGLHLDKDDPVVLLNDQIDFSAFETPVFGDHLKTLFLEKFRRKFFAFVAGFDFIAHAKCFTFDLQ